LRQTPGGEFGSGISILLQGDSGLKGRAMDPFWAPVNAQEYKRSVNRIQEMTAGASPGYTCPLVSAKLMMPGVC